VEKLNNINNNKALLVIDIQEDATGKTTNKPYKNSKELIDTVNSVINNSEKEGITVIYIKHQMNSNFLNKIIMGNRFIKGTPGSEIDSRIEIINNNIFSKDKGDALSNSKLDDFLKQNNINEIFIVGLDATACVYKTAIGAIKRGYKAVVLKDGIVTSNMEKMPRILDEYEKRGILLTSIDKFIEMN
jgi:nicotinamidase-related amidase